MAGKISAGADALAVDAKDHVATALRDLKTGETITYRISDTVGQIIALNDIPFGHKIAIKDLPAGTLVNKYGEVIGRATADIPAGAHVHVHNVEGIRGRGDQAQATQAAAQGGKVE